MKLPVVCTLGRGDEYRRWLRGLLRKDRWLTARADIRVPADDKERDRLLAGAEVHASYRYSEAEFRLTPNLKWLHLGLAGAETALFPAMMKSRVMITSSVGLHEETVPFAAWAFVLSFATGLHEGYRQKQEKTWDRKTIVRNRRLLSQQRIVIIGTGRIGTQIARLAKSAGMEVFGVRRAGGAPKPPHFDRVVTRGSLHRLLPTADYVILIIPGGESTRRMFGKAELDLMKPSAYLINMARGSVVDERALISALRKKRIAGAGLDVFAQEPLPPEHPFYTLPNVAMTPHTSGDTIDYAHRATAMFLENLRLYLAGRPLFNVVDKKRGY